MAVIPLYLKPVDMLRPGEFYSIIEDAANVAVEKARKAIELAGEEVFIPRHARPSDFTDGTGTTLSSFTLTATAAGTVTYIKTSIPKNRVYLLIGFAFLTPSTKVDEITIKKGANIMGKYRLDELKAVDHPIFLLPEWYVWGPDETMEIDIDVTGATSEEVIPIVLIAEPKGEEITA